MHFEGKLGLLDEVIRKLLWQHYACSKKLLQNQDSTTKNHNQTTQKMHND